MTCTIGGRTVAYMDSDPKNAAGKPVVLFLHGWGAPHTVYKGLLDSLSPYCRVIAPDFPGFGGNYVDCGCELFGSDKSVNAGASGCGCSALYLAKVLSDFETGKIKRALFMSTGALHNPTVLFQKETIPSVAHAVALETE